MKLNADAHLLFLEKKQKKTVRYDPTAKGAVHIEHILFENVRCKVV